MLYMASLHISSKQLSAPLSDGIQEKYHKKSARVIEGDTVKVMRGEFKGIEGKVTQVSTEKRGIAIEGIKREKLKGGSVDIYIHTSNVMLTDLNLEDKWRQNRLEGQKPTTERPSQKQKETEASKAEPQETPKPKEKQKVEPTKEKSKQKEPKTSDKPEKKKKQTKTKSKRSDK